jgi:hypothetical protein
MPLLSTCFKYRKGYKEANKGDVQFLLYCFNKVKLRVYVDIVH